MTASNLSLPTGQNSPPTNSFSIEHTVTAGDTSAVGPVYYARLIDWQGHCREQCGMLVAPRFSSDISGAYAMLTRSCSCEYENEIWFGDRVCIRLTVPWVRLHLMKGEFTYHRLTDDGEQLVARGEQIWASARRVGSAYQPCPWPRELVDGAAALGADISRAQVAERTS
ncbi:acyl-CoA thioesterase [Streptomyces sp. NPDC002577]